MRGGASALIASSFVACVPEIPFAEFPAADPSTSWWLIAREHVGGLVEREAVVGSELQLPRFEPTSDLARLSLLRFESSMDALLIEPGPLVSADESGCFSTLPAPAETYVLEPANGDLHFKVDPQGPSEKASAPVVVRCPCDELTMTPVELGTLGPTMGIKHLSGGRWLVVTVTRLLVLDAAGMVETSSSVARGREWTAMASIGPDAALVARKSGAVFTWRDGVIAPFAPVGASVVDLVAAPDAKEAFVLDDVDGLYRYDGTEWSKVYTATVLQTRQRPALTWIREGRATATLLNAIGLAEYGWGGAPRVAETMWDSRVEPGQGLYHHPDYGLLLSTRSDRVWIREDDEAEWVVARDNGHNIVAPEAFMPWGDRGFFILHEDQITQYHRASGMCPPIDLPKPLKGRAGDTDGNGSALLGGSLEHLPNMQAFVTRLFLLQRRN